jgi:predicted permease
MRIWLSIRTFLDFLFGLVRIEREMEEELRAHLRRRADDLEHQGLSRAEAERQARIEFGGYQRYKEECREAVGIRLLREIMADVRYGLRQLRRSPGFTAVAVITLALGIGANTAIFSLIDAVMLKLLPVQKPEQLFVLDWASQGLPYFIHGIDGHEHADNSGRRTSTAFSYQVFEAMHTRNRVFSSVFGFYGGDRLNVSAAGQSALASSEFISGDYFSTLGVKPALGRVLTPADDAVGASPAAVISYSYWSQRFGRDPSVVGKAITVSGVPFTLVGIAASEFFGLQRGRPVGIWIPLHLLSQVEPNWWWLPKGKSVFTARGEWWVVTVGRLKPDVTRQQAQTQLTLILQQSTAGIEAPPAQRSADVSLAPPKVELVSAANGLAALRREFSQPLFVLMAVVGLVLLIACANVANLLLARSKTRQREVAVRLALGAGRRRLIRQLLTESVLLAAAGGAVGVVLAFWASDALLALMSSGSESLQLHVSPDLRVLGFTALISLLTGILFGFAPALTGTRLSLTGALKEGAGSAVGRARRARGLRLDFRDVLVSFQIAISLLLLIGAGLFVRTLTNLTNQDLGFDRRNLVLFAIDPSQAGYKGDRLTSFYQGLQRRIEALPGVRSASLSVHTLVGGGEGTRGISIEGYVPKPGEARDGSISTYTHFVDSRFFETYGIPLLLGRSTGDGDSQKAPEVGVINHAFARKYFGDANPIGRRFSFGGSKKSSDIAIIGVVGDATYGDLRSAPPPTVYVPYAQHLDQLPAMNFAVRTAGDPKNWINSVRRAAQGFDKSVPVSGVDTETEQMDQATLQERLLARLLSFFGMLALFLAGIGLYGVMAYSVAQRINEIGLRMALGAQPHDVLGLILRRGAALTLAGVGLGIAAALALTRLIASFLFGLTPSDPLTFASAAMILTAVALAASYVPARRATKVDPMVALRYE